MRQNPRAGGFSACLILLLTLTISSCHKNVDGPAVSKPLDLPADAAPVLSAGNNFAIDIFHKVVQYDSNSGNKLISPLSIYTALSMAYNGAAGTTRDAMAKTLSLNGISVAQLNAVSKALIEQMPHEDSKVQLSIANSMWYDQHHQKPLPGFLDSIQSNFQAVMQSLDFSDPSSVKTINSWVSQHTSNKIPNVIGGLSPDELMVLINAIYFNGAWKKVFKTKDTHNASFYRQDGTTVSVPFMNQTSTFRYYKAPSFQIAELPYGTGTAFNMYVLLPSDPQQPVRSFAASLDQATLTAAFSGMDSANVQLTLPKWESSYNISNLAPHLSDMGMGIAFRDGANFSNIYASGGVAISAVIHKTYIKVSEEGTEAAAVTAIIFYATSVLPPAAIPLKLDHPFVYLITEKQTGSILFIGLVNDPAAK